MKRIVAYCWGLLWHKLEIELIRVGEPFRGVAGDFLGVALHFITARIAKIINHIFFKRVSLHYSIHASNNLAYPTLWSQ